ncbi:MAG TPA: D-arabinono-1,4-lactone oxidase [Burkholderiaceae bacterium]
MKRRHVLLAAAALATGGIASRFWRRDGVPQAPVDYRPGGPLPWFNWAGNQYCFPQQRVAPASEDELVAALKHARGVVRAVGAGHSFSGCVPTDDVLVSTDLLAGLIDHDESTLRAQIWAGTRMHNLGPMLDSVGQALPNQPDMDYLAMGGAIVNGAHATGKTFGSMPSYVTAMTLATPSGDLFECSAAKNADIFQAARVSVGALGIVSRITLQNVKPVRLVEVNRVEKTNDILDDIEQRCRRHRHFEFLPLPHCTLSATVATDVASGTEQAKGSEDPEAVHTLQTVYDTVGWIPAIGDAAYETMLEAALGSAASEIRTGWSYEVFPHVRTVRFREMEYTVPAEAGVACIREILDTIKIKRIPVCFPLECRFIKQDDIWLSPFYGRDGCAISVHQFGSIDHRPYFAEIEPIFWKYQGRPHWGKIHTLDAARLASLYPRWKDFQDVRRQLDPDGRMMNRHLQTIFGSGRT